jgi:hypothetical protein
VTLHRIREHRATDRRLSRRYDRKVDKLFPEQVDSQFPFPEGISGIRTELFKERLDLNHQAPGPIDYRSMVPGRLTLIETCNCQNSQILVNPLVGAL